MNGLSVARLLIGTLEMRYSPVAHRRMLLFALCLLFFHTPASSRMQKIVVDRVESPTFDGAHFGSVGQYEKIVGRMFGDIDPGALAHQALVNLPLAPTNELGRVAYTTDFHILKPVNPERGNRTLLTGILNRGNKLALVLLNDVPYGQRTNDPSNISDAGNGFLMKQGYTIVWVGWQAKGAAGAQCCVPQGPGHMGAKFPIPDRDGEPIVGPTLDMFVGGEQTDGPDHTTATLSYAVSSPQANGIQVTVSDRGLNTTSTEILHCSGAVGKNPCWTMEHERTIRVLGGFQSGRLYRVRYKAKDPIVLGLGFPVIRDAISFLRYERTDDAGTPNPLTSAGGKVGINTALALGISQSGRYLQEHVWLGFNVDEHDRIVFDGLVSDIGGAGKTFTNFAFGQPGRTRGSHRDWAFPENWFPFSFDHRTNPVTGEKDGLLRTGTGEPGDGFDPLIIITNTASEYWRKSASLLHTSAHGADITIHPSVRLYFFSSTQHFPVFGKSFSTSIGERIAAGACTEGQNPAYRGPVMRALLIALHEWADRGRPPPPSIIPTIREHTLVPANVSIRAFPKIPDVIHIGAVTPSFNPTESSESGTYWPSLVPTVDTDGNDLGGIRLPDIAVPLGTHTGWATRADVPGTMCGNSGQFIPFARTLAERTRTTDPRLSLEERYDTTESYVTQITEAVNKLQARRLLLADDAAAYISDARLRAPSQIQARHR